MALLRELPVKRHQSAARSDSPTNQRRLIACLIILIYTGSQPTKRTFEMICLYLQGWTEQDELEAHIKKLKAKRETKKAESKSQQPLPLADGSLNAAR